MIILQLGLVFYVVCILHAERSSKLKGALYPTNTHIAAWLFFVPRRQDTLLKMLLAAARHANFFIFADQHIICCFLISLDFRLHEAGNILSYLSKILQLRAASRNMANIVKIITTSKTAYDFELPIFFTSRIVLRGHIIVNIALRITYIFDLYNDNWITPLFKIYLRGTIHLVIEMSQYTPLYTIIALALIITR
ncbi:hypothetical protein ACJX0J_040341 [Zea mays]